MDGQVLFAALLIGGGTVVQGWILAEIEGSATLIVGLLLFLGPWPSIVRAIKAS